MPYDAPTAPLLKSARTTVPTASSTFRQLMSEQRRTGKCRTSWKLTCRCARNCFQCPACYHSLSVLASDNTVQNVPPTAAEASIGVPPYFLHCSSCKWTSSEIGMKFDKPTGLARECYLPPNPLTLRSTAKDRRSGRGYSRVRQPQIPFRYLSRQNSEHYDTQTCSD